VPSGPARWQGFVQPAPSLLARVHAAQRTSRGLRADVLVLGIPLSQGSQQPPAWVVSSPISPLSPALGGAQASEFAHRRSGNPGRQLAVTAGPNREKEVAEVAEAPRVAGKSIGAGLAEDPAARGLERSLSHRARKGVAASLNEAAIRCLNPNGRRRVDGSGCERE
jgi:hypothetical protein